MKAKLITQCVVLSLVSLVLTACKEDVNVSDVDTDDIVLDAGVAAPVAYSTVYGTKLYEIKDNGYYVYPQPDGTVVVALRARKHIPVQVFINNAPQLWGITEQDLANIDYSQLPPLQLVDSIDLSDFFIREITRDMTHIPIINPYFEAYICSPSNFKGDLTFSNVFVITSALAQNHRPSNYMGSNVYTKSLNPVYQYYREGQNAEDYVKHYLDSVIITNQEANFESFFATPPGELPQYLQYDFTFRLTDVSQLKLNEEMLLDAWFHLPINSKGLVDKDPYGLIIDYYDTLEVNGRDFYDEEIDSLIAKHTDFLTLYIDGKNATPLEIGGSAYYLDGKKRALQYSNGVVRRDSLKFPGAIVDADGRVVMDRVEDFPTQIIHFGNEAEVKFPYDTIGTRLTDDRRILRDMRYIVVRLHATGTKDGDAVHIYDTDYIRLKVSARAHAHAWLNQITD